ncbi:hypothetical protein KI387_004755, partial [Taxus chinensis]
VAIRIYLHIRPKFEKGAYLENDVSIPEDPVGRKKVAPRKREREEVQKALSVQTKKMVSAPETCAKPSTYAQRKKSPMKTKTLEEEASEHEEPLTLEESPRNISPIKEKEKEESHVLESPIRKKQKVMDEAN